MRLSDWGSIGYAEALARQTTLASEVAGRQVPETIISCQHPPTITLGRHAPASDVLASARELGRRGIEMVRSDRGGRATFHGPGQAVVYPVVRLADHGLSVVSWVAMLEDLMALRLERSGIAVDKRPEGPGLWAGGGKIASIGLRVVRGVSYHGLAVNVSLDVSSFDCIVTCGAAAAAVTDIARETGSAVGAAEFGRSLARDIANKLDGDTVHEQARA